MDRWLCALLCGYAVAFLLPSTPTWDAWLCLLVSTLVILGMTFCVHSKSIRWVNYTESHPRRLAFALSSLAAVLCGITWGIGNATLALKYVLPKPTINTTVTLQIRITEIPRIEDNYWQLEGVVSEMSGASINQKPMARLNWYEPEQNLTPPSAGDTWLVAVKLRAPQGPRNQGSFLYHRYLIAEGIQILGTVRHGQQLHAAATWRQRLYDDLQVNAGDLPFFGVLLALVMGQREHLTDTHRMVFQRTGLAHLIAISGLHLTLLVGAALWLGQVLRWWLSRSRSRRDGANSLTWAWWFAVLLAMLYAWLAGFATATLRALVMVLVFVLHRRFAQRVSVWRVLVRTVAVVLVFEPMAPLKSGFWLSVCAVGIILWMHWRWPRITGSWRELRVLWRLECVITAALWPFMLLWFGGLPVAAPLTNLLLVPVFAVWILPLALVGLCFMLLGLPAVTHFIWWLAEWPLRIVWPFLDWLSTTSWQWLTTAETWPLWAVLGALLMAAWPLAWRWRLASFGALFIAVSIGQTLRTYDSNLVVTLLDVEQGSAAVLERQGYALLIDTGAKWPTGTDIAERIVLPYLAQQRLTPELAFISHTDLDHSGGFATIQRTYPRVRWFGRTPPDGHLCIAGQTGEWRGVQWRVLHPRRSYNNHHNNNSCVIQVTYRDLVILFPGDIEQAAERNLLAHSAPVQADVLVLAHHGSNSSSESYFLDHVRPSVTIASRGRNNAYGMVDERVRERIQQRALTLMDTAQGGQVQLRTNGYQWSIQQPLAAKNGGWFDRDN
ncbi:DNA internalization-related competence protein ComEC/Rec2 [Pseudidiomarina aestuarii]|uniref:DNA internalization-related competence protein ComEC/Rec2 n=1 Tax=Pseudidiomarina aestuarii TaxID=624146 RepID=A0A7Z6ZT35_9GAMM|nr:DNA internalization-related competence protein ComEC/Rec2 [Pseudidiomarina aestuarii]RUO40835.1 DNA internalization-related competence protein ComEC/Rec2 [Pseudidiomarina aestuarii]